MWNSKKKKKKTKVKFIDIELKSSCQGWGLEKTGRGWLVKVYNLGPGW